MKNVQKLPSDALTKPSRRAPWIIAAASVLAIAGSAIAFGPAIGAQLSPAPAATHSVSTVGDDSTALTPDELAAVQQAATAQQAQIQADIAAAQAPAAQKAAAQAAADAQATAAKASTSVQHCPAGTKAGAVDDQGNESNCSALNGTGQSCQAYDDNNNCTAWGALAEGPLKP